MPITKQKKTEILTKLNTELKGAETIVFVGFKGLKMNDTTAMRKELRTKGVTYFVAKKTLIRRALDARGITGTMPETPGEIAIAWSTDPIAPAKGVHEFVKKHKDQVVLYGGVFQGEYYSQSQIQALALIPSRQELYGQFVGMLNATYAGVARVLEARRVQLEATPA